MMFLSSEPEVLTTSIFIWSLWSGLNWLRLVRLLKNRPVAGSFSLRSMVRSVAKAGAKEIKKADSRSRKKVVTLVIVIVNCYGG